MSDRTAARGPFIALLIVLIFFISYCYGAVLAAPNSFLLGHDGDALKNYYTFLYHITYDKDAWQFMGMVHPYGEHVFFTDGHPLLSVLLIGLKNVFPSVPHYGIGILNVLMVLAIPLCAIVLYALLRELSLRPWVAAAAAFGITVLAPQVDRMYGHYSLSYSVFLPLTWLLLIRALRSQRWMRWCLVLSLSSVVWWGTHAYLGAMVSVFGTLYLAGVLAVRWKERKEWGRRLLFAFVAVFVVPIGFFEEVLFLTDHHTGRPEHPSGFFNYTAEPDDLLLPSRPPLRPLLDRLTDHSISQQWEAHAYIGIATILVLIAWPIIAVRRKRNKLQRDPLPLELRAALWSALVLLLYAFCVPFKDLPQLLRWLPVFEQFRATGRFDWPFYFVITVTAAFLLDRWMQRLELTGKNKAIILHVLFPLSLVIEGFDAHAHVNWSAREGNVFNTEHVTATQLMFHGNLEAARFQAIVPMPYFNVGCEAFSDDIDGNASRVALPLSYATGLPLMASILSRASVHELKQLAGIVAPRYYPKPILQHLPDARPFLIVRGDGPLTVYEMDILRDAEPLDSANGTRLYVITKARLFRSVNVEEWRRFEQVRPGLKEKDGFLVPDSATTFVHLDFDELASDITYRGRGAFRCAKVGDHDVAKVRLSGVAKSTPMIASCWMYNAFPDGLNLGLRMEVAQQGVEAARIAPDTSQVIQGDWTLVELPFTTAKDDAEITVRTIFHGYIDKPLIVDELLVRPASVDIYRDESSATGRKELFLNDHRIPAP